MPTKPMQAPEHSLDPRALNVALVIFTAAFGSVVLQAASTETRPLRKPRCYHIRCKSAPDVAIRCLIAGPRETELIHV